MRKPNFNFERQERDKAKAAKKAAKADAKSSKADRGTDGSAEAGADNPQDGSEVSGGER